MNPKTLTIEELYGNYNQARNEWVDGILPSIMRKIETGNYYYLIDKLQYWQLLYLNIRIKYKLL